MSVRQSKPSYPPPPVAREVPTAPPQQARWAVLFYIAGDLGELSGPVADDLREILQTGATEELAIVAQYDGPEGAARYVLPIGAATDEPVERLGRIDSGSSHTLAEFLRWALSVVQAPRIALVLTGLSGWATK